MMSDHQASQSIHGRGSQYLEHATSDGRMTSMGTKSQMPLNGTDKNGLSLQIVRLYQRDPAKNRPKLVPTDMEYHGGWVQSIATEKRNIVESIDNSIKYGYTKDPERAKQILQHEL